MRHTYLLADLIGRLVQSNYEQMPSKVCSLVQTGQEDWEVLLCHLFLHCGHENQLPKHCIPLFGVLQSASETSLPTFLCPCCVPAQVKDGVLRLYSALLNHCSELTSG